MAGILDVVRAAIQPAAAARTGYLAGQEIGRERRRAEQQQDLALARQGLLDQIKAAVDQSTIERNAAQAKRYDEMPNTAYEIVQDEDGSQFLQNKNDPTDIRPVSVNGRTLKKPPSGSSASSAPRTITTKNGIMMWDPAQKKWVPTGFTAPSSGRGGAGSATEDRIDAKTAYDAALKGVPRPSTVPAEIVNPAIMHAAPGTDIKQLPTMVKNPERSRITADSLAYEQNTLGPLRKHLNDVTVGDKVPLGGTSRPASGGAAPAAPPPQSRADRDAMQREFDEASQNLNAVLASNAPESVKQRARDLYNRQQAAIAKKYHATTNSGQP